jgi:hypothetical protein
MCLVRTEEVVKASPHVAHSNGLSPAMYEGWGVGVKILP